MKKIATLLLVSSLSLSFAGSARAEDPRASQRMENAQTDTMETLQQASRAYKEVLENKSGRPPQSIQKAAKCVAIFPGVISAAVAVGGVHGDGVAFCKNSTGKWSNPVFLDLTGASIGVQAGVRKADLVLYMTNDNAKAAMEKGNFTLTGELSAVAGSFDESFSARQAGVVAYTQTEGVFAGAALNGVMIKRDKEDEKEVYGSTLDKDVFERQVPQKISETVGTLDRMLPA